MQKRKGVICFLFLHDLVSTKAFKNSARNDMRVTLTHTNDNTFIVIISCFQIDSPLLGCLTCFLLKLRWCVICWSTFSTLFVPHLLQFNKLWSALFFFLFCWQCFHCFGFLFCSLLAAIWNGLSISLHLWICRVFWLDLQRHLLPLVMGQISHLFDPPNIMPHRALQCGDTSILCSEAFWQVSWTADRKGLLNQRQTCCFSMHFRNCEKREMFSRVCHFATFANVLSGQRFRSKSTHG